MRILILLAALVAIAPPAPTRVTVAQLEQILTTACAAHKSDTQIVRQIRLLELSERLTETTLGRLTADLASFPETVQSLQLLADQSIFLMPPASEIPAIAPPDDYAQGRVLDAARSYVAQTLPLLPNFLATRTTRYFDDSPQQLTKNAWPVSAGLHLVRTSSMEISVRNDQRVLSSAAEPLVQGKEAQAELTSWGEFGPVLGMIVEDTAKGSLSWSRWESSAATPVAVFKYSVPRPFSHFQLDGFSPEQFGQVDSGGGVPGGGILGMRPSLDIPRSKPYHITPGYHGDLWLDPATGTILRITIEADLKGRDPVKRADTLIEYGPVSISGHSFICPVRSLTLHLDPVNPNDTTGAAPILQLNEIQFTNYHRFASTMRILTGAQQQPDFPSTGSTGPPDSASQSAMPQASEPQLSVPQTSENVPATESAEEPHTEAVAPVANAPAQTDTVLHVTSNLVLVDVVVADKGKPVHGLDRSWFHVLEDGHEEPISSFEDHEPAAAPAAAASPTSIPPNVYSNLPIYPKSTAVNVLLLDELNTPEGDLQNVRRKTLEYLGKIPPGAWLAVFTLSSRLQLVSGFTTDVAQLTAALRKQPLRTAINSEMDNPAQHQIETLQSDIASGPMKGPSRSSAPGLGGQDEKMLEIEKAAHTDQRAQMTLAALQGLARYLSAVPGRKNLIWFSGSFPIALFPVKIDAQYGPTNRKDSVRETCELLSAARVAVYPVDARGLATPTALDIEKSRMAAAAPPPVEFAGQAGADHDSMRQIAEETGGQAYVNTNGLREALAAVIENGASYYTIGYVPTKQPDGRFRTIQLRLDNGHYDLAYRRGYYADTGDKPFGHSFSDTSVLLAATLLGAPPSTQILFQARVLPASEPQFEGTKLPEGPAGEMTATLKGKVQRTIVDLRVDPRGLTFVETQSGIRQAQIELTLVAYDAEGKRANYLDHGIQLNLKPEQYSRIMASDSTISLRGALDLPAGQISLRIAVYDPATVRVGSLEVPVSVVAK